jgi:hypothetical protein
LFGELTVATVPVPGYVWPACGRSASRQTRPVSGLRRLAPAPHLGKYPWPFQEPKPEIPTIYKAYMRAFSHNSYALFFGTVP